MVSRVLLIPVILLLILACSSGWEEGVYSSSDGEYLYYEEITYNADSTEFDQPIMRISLLRLAV